MANPFELLEHKLNRIEALLELNLKLPEKALNPTIESNFIPVQEIFKKGGYCSKPTFYGHVKNGLIPLYKLGNRSFVKHDELHRAFKKVNIGKENFSAMQGRGGKHA